MSFTDMYVASIFSSLWFAFLFLKVSFKEQTYLILIKSDLCIFKLDFVFCEKSMSNPRS